MVCHDATVDRTTDGHGRIADLTLAELQALDNAYWFIPGADVTPGRPDGGLPLPGPGAPTTPTSGSPPCARCSRRFPGVVLNLDIKQTAPDVAPYEATLAGLLAEFGRTDDVIVASFLDPAHRRLPAVAPESRPRPAPWPRPSSGGRCTPGPSRPTAGRRPPGARAPGRPGGRGRGVRRGRPRAGHRRPRVDDQRRRAMERLVDLGVDGIISDLPTTLAGGASRRPGVCLGREAG